VVPYIAVCGYAVRMTTRGMSCPAAGPGTVARVNLFAYRLRPGQLVALDAAAGAGYTLVLLAAALARPPGRAGWFEALVVAAIGLPVAARRRWPWPTMGVVTAATILAMALDVVREPFAATAYALYPAALRIPRHRREPTVVIAVATAVGLVGLFVAGQPPGFDADIGLIVVGVVLVGSAWTVGRAVRERREYARRYAAELAERAATEERLRIARDLHDVVSHTLSLSLNLFGGFGTACLVEVLGFADRWMRGDLLVTGAGWATRPWPGGFRRTGGNRQFPARVAKPAPHAGGGQPAWFGGWSFPRASQVAGEVTAQAELGVGDDG
jgi:Histidine kinase